MKQKLHLKRRYRRTKLKKWQLLVISIVLILIVTFVLINRIGTIINVKLMEYAEVEANKISKTIINYAVNDIVMNNLETDSLFTTVQNKSGDIQAIDFDAGNVNQLLNDISQNILKYFRLLEKGATEDIDFVKRILPGSHKIEDGIIMEIPTGIITGNSLLSNIGPKIPVKISMIGDLESSVSTSVDKYGINNAIITVNVDIVVSEQVILPMHAKKITIKNQIPIAMKVIQGVVPNYYIDGIDANSNLYSTPTDES